MQPHSENKEDNLLTTHVYGQAEQGESVPLYFVLLPSNLPQFNIVKIGHVCDRKEQKLEVG